MSNQQPQPQDPTPQRDRRIMSRTRAQGRGGGEELGRAEERRRSTRNPTGVVDAMWEIGGTLAEIGETVDKKVLVQYTSTQTITRIRKKHGDKRMTLRT